MTVKHVKEITYCGQQVVVGCDGKCSKAWGTNTRPRRHLSKEEDDYVYESDSALGTAPEDPGTYEGNHGKPCGCPAERDLLNKWCVRECERSAMVRAGETLALPDFDRPKPNMDGYAREIHRRVVPHYIEVLLPPHPIEFIVDDNDDGRSCMACGFSVPGGMRAAHRDWCEKIGRKQRKDRESHESS